MTAAKRPLSLLGREIAAATGQPGPSPRKIHDLVLRGLIPAEMVNGRWLYEDDAVPAAIAALGLRVTA